MLLLTFLQFEDCTPGILTPLVIYILTTIERSKAEHSTTNKRREKEKE